MQIENLMQLGFTEKEAMVYLTLLRLGPSPVSLIAKRLSIKRVSAYYVLNSLCEKGIITFEQGGNGRKFIPHDPECILYNLEKQELDLKTRMQVAKKCIDKLHTNDISQTPIGQKIVYHKGINPILKFLYKNINDDYDTYVIFPDYGSESESSIVLDRFLSERLCINPHKVFICVPKGRLKSAELLYKGATVAESNIHSVFISGELIMQEKR